MKDVIKALTDGTNAELAALFAPDMELYENELTRYFARPMRREISFDTSKIFADIRRLAAELRSVKLNDETEFEENLRLRFGENPMHVAKFKKTKAMREIVFKWSRDRWLIWEFNAGTPKSDSVIPMTAFRPGKLASIADTLVKGLIERPNLILSGPKKTPRFSVSYQHNPYLVTVESTGETRPSPEPRIELTRVFFRTNGSGVEAAAKFKTEFKFVEDGKSYWIAVEDAVAEKLNKYGKGAEVVLYVSWLGFIHSSESPESVILVLNAELIREDAPVASVNWPNSQETH